MSVYKLTPDKKTKFEINDIGRLDLGLGYTLHSTKLLVAEKELLNRSYFDKNAILDDSREVYILKYHPHDSVFAVVFDKSDWKKQRSGSYTRQIKEMYCDDNGLKTIWDLSEITLMRGGFLTPSYKIKKEQEALNELNSLNNADAANAALNWLGNENYLDFIIKHKDTFKEKGLFEHGLFRSITSVNMNMISKYYSSDILLQLLKEANKEKLRKCGDLFEPKGEIVAYRGIPNSKEKFRINRVSWTLNLEIAEFFAKYCSRRDRSQNYIAAVYKAIVPPEAIFFYTNDRNEQEVVIDPDQCEKTIEELWSFSTTVNPNEVN